MATPLAAWTSGSPSASRSAWPSAWRSAIGPVSSPDLGSHSEARSAAPEVFGWSRSGTSHALEGAGDGLAGFRVELVALCDDAGVDLASLLGTPALLQLLTPAGERARRPFHGLISEAGWLGSDGGLGRVRLLVEPWLALLRERQDARVFHEASVVEIVDAVFAASRDAFADALPEWRWSLADPDASPRRGRCVQAHESDLAFVERLLRDEGLFFWFEHEAEPGGSDARPPPPRHRRRQRRVAAGTRQRVRALRRRRRGTTGRRAGRWRESRRLVANELHWASRDDRSVALRPVSALPPTRRSRCARPTCPATTRIRPAATASGSPPVRLQALGAFAARGEAAGSWRDAAAACWFTLVDHPVHDGGQADRDRFVVVAVRHRLRNDVPAGALADRAGGAGAGRDAGRADADSGGPGHHREIVFQPRCTAAAPDRAGPRCGRRRPAAPPDRPRRA
ncbi:MAG: phage late control D family protein [Comamonadaceae bacterium]|nr:phage late control D family protein [Comamonadaceae bacterium]